MRDQRVLVAGGGIAGMAAALAFARRASDVTVFEQAPALTEIGAGLQISPNGAAVLAALGLEPEAAARGIAARAIQPMDALAGRVIGTFDLAARPGHPYRFFHRADLLDMLAVAAVQAGVTIRTGARVAAFDPAGAMTSAAGREEGHVLVGADGLHSNARRALNGDVAPFFTGFAAWRAIIPAEAAAPVVRLWMAPGRHVVTYPLPGGRLNIVAVHQITDWVDEGWNHPDDPANLVRAFRDCCSDLRALLGQVDSLWHWGLFRHPVATRWQEGRLALIGDAAHPTLPFLGQGANLALEDAWVLAQLAQAGDSVPRSIAGFRDMRAPRVERAIATANSNARNYHLAGLPRRVAHLGLGALARVAPERFLNRLDWLYGHDVTREAA